MKQIPLFHASTEVSYPPKAPPAWAAKVERWTQLDPFAYFLPQAFSVLAPAFRPHCMLLACEGASNLTDHAFASGGAISPSKFVHTLPNIRSSALLSVMEWQGPVFSLHRDPFTLSAAFEEAVARAEAGTSCWVWNANAEGKVHLFAFGENSGATHQILRRAQDSSASSTRSDVEILRWFWDSKGDFDMSQQWMVRKG